MASLIDRTDRNVIPRWRTAKATLEMGESRVGSGRAMRGLGIWEKIKLTESLDRLHQDFQRHPSISYAVDLVSAAFSSGDSLAALDAARLILQDTNSPRLAKEIAQRIIWGEQQKGEAVSTLTAAKHEKNADTSRLRSLLRANERDAFAWMDLARIQTTLGQRQKAERSVRTALGLAPHDRFVLRAASRFFVHVGDLARAHHIIRSATSLFRDPWLAAAEVALSIAAGSPSFTAKAARSILDNDDFSTFDTSELAAALATLEFSSGAGKKSKKLLRRAIINPTENSLAQAGWLSENIGGIDLVSEIDSTVANTRVARPFEAKAGQSYLASRWGDALKNAECWLGDQPFSSRPAILASHIRSGIMGDYEGAIKIVELSQRANPKDPVLFNITAFCMGSLGRLDEAMEALGRVPAEGQSVSVAIIRLGNMGLLEFRRGNLENGRFLYGEAERASIKAKHATLQSLALLYWAREEALAGTGEGTKVLQRAQDAMKSAEGSPEALGLDQQYARVLRVVKKSLQ